MTGDYIRGYIVGMPFFVRVFLKSNDPQALDLCIECIREAAFSIPFYSVVYNFNNYLMAVKRLRFDTFYSFLIECGNLVPITFLLLQVVGYQGAWIGRVVNMLELALLAVFYIHCQKEKGSFGDKMLLMPASFGIPNENEISVTADSTEEILDLSHIAVAFALEHGADKKRARSFGLLT